jgi:hypothetical protein
MGKKTAAPPPAPDPVKTAQAQTASNTETARLNARMNRLDEIGPDGTVTYRDLGNDRAQRITKLTPEGQKAYDLERKVDTGTNNLALQGVGQAGKVLGQSFTLDGLTPEASRGSIEADRARYEGALSSRLEPQFERDRAGMEQRLADQGISPGTEAYGRSMDELNRAKTDARMQVISQGGNEGRAEDANVAQLRQRQMQEALLKRSQPINEIGALLGTGQVSMPNFGQATPVNVQGTDIMGAYQAKNAADMARHGTQQGAANAQSGSTAGLLGTAAMAAATIF